MKTINELIYDLASARKAVVEDEKLCLPYVNRLATVRLEEREAYEAVRNHAINHFLETEESPHEAVTFRKTTIVEYPEEENIRAIIQNEVANAMFLMYRGLGNSNIDYQVFIDDAVSAINDIEFPHLKLDKTSYREAIEQGRVTYQIEKRSTKWVAAVRQKLGEYLIRSDHAEDNRHETD